MFLYYVAMMIRCFQLSALTNDCALIYLWSEIHSFSVGISFGVYSLDTVGYIEHFTYETYKDIDRYMIEHHPSQNYMTESNQIEA